MRLLLVSVDAPPRLGGVAAMTHHLAECFAAEARWCGLLGPAGAHAPKPSRYAMIEDFESRIELRDTAMAEMEDRRIAGLIEAVLDRYAPDALLLCHAHYYGLGALAAARARGVRIATIVHGLEVASQIVPGASPEKAQRLRPLLDDVDVIFANSCATAAMLRQTGARAPVALCGVGLAVEDFARETARSPGLDDARRRERKGRLGFSDAPMIAYVGRLARHKRVDRLFDILAGAPQMQAVIAGAGPMRAELEHIAHARGVADRTRFLGAISESEKWALLRAADFHCLFSENDSAAGAYEGFGIALLEGCAAGSVALSSGVDGMADFVVAAQGGVALDFGGGGADAAARVRALLAAPAQRAAIVARGRAAIAERWLWPAVAQRIADVWLGEGARTVEATA